MKKFASLTIVMLLVSFTHATVSPIPGYYVSQELSDSGVVNDGIVLDGRWSEAYPTGQPGEVDSAIQAGSWDGSLGTMWEISDQTLASVAPIGPLVDLRGGRTLQVYSTTYNGACSHVRTQAPGGTVQISGLNIC